MRRTARGVALSHHCLYCHVLLLHCTNFQRESACGSRDIPARIYKVYASVSGEPTLGWPCRATSSIVVCSWYRISARKNIWVTRYSCLNLKFCTLLSGEPQGAWPCGATSAILMFFGDKVSIFSQKFYCVFKMFTLIHFSKVRNMKSAAGSRISACHLFVPHILLTHSLDFQPEIPFGFQDIRADTFFQGLKCQVHSWL